VTSDFQAPKWAREIERFIGVKSQFILWGNVHDVYPYQTADGVVDYVSTLGEYLQVILRQAGYSHLWQYEPFNLSLLGDKERAKEIAAPPEEGAVVILPDLSALAAKLVQATTPAALLINHASRLPGLCPREHVEQFYYNLFNLSLKARHRKGRGFNPIFLVMDKDSDLPLWYSQDNPRVRVLPLPKPDHSIRRHIIEKDGPKISGFNGLDENNRKEFVSLFGDQTGGLFASEIISIRRLAEADKLETTKIAEAVRRYKLGIPDNPWDKLDLASIKKKARMDLTRKVIGQETAVDHSLKIVKRSIFGLSGAQFSPTAQRPKGVMFFAGPTGVGKTELAKCLADLTATHFIRFDMSEFNGEHAVQRLLGAPPSYVGFEGGGELTNAVKQNPFSLILFDEIEKAHPRLMDIFLQILDDGRLTSGRGETVYFSETLIIFTSNLGVYQETADGRREPLTMPAEEDAEAILAVRKKITNAISDFFISRLNRPEILNRIGPNIVVFDFIRPKVAEGIFEKMLNNVLNKLRDNNKINITLGDDDKRLLGEVACHDLSMGGRGIGNTLEQVFVNPLAEELLEVEAKAGKSYTCRLSQENGQIILSLDEAG